MGSGKEEEFEHAKIELIKALQLDSVWVGLLYRIGTDVEEFQDYLTTSEHFEVWQTYALRHFLESVERQVASEEREAERVKREAESVKREDEIVKREDESVKREDESVKREALRSVMGRAAREVLERQGSYNSRVEEVIRSKFNQRVVIADVTCHEYLHLLTSRSYFHLIYIEGQLLLRFQNFKRQIACAYPRLLSLLSLDAFVLLDDFVPLA